MNESPIFDAIRRRAADDLEKLLQERPVLANIRDPWNLPPLQRAADDTELVRVLLAAGARVDERSPNGETALHHAIDNPRAMRLLLDAGADCQAASRTGWTPLHRAALHGSAEAIEVLLAAGADLRARVDTGDTPLHIAAGDGLVDNVRLFLTRDIDLELRDAQGQTALHAVAIGGHRRDEREPAAAALLAAGADPLARDENGDTPLHLAGQRGYTHVAVPLLTRPGVLEARNNVGRTPLYSALEAGERHMVKLLLEAGADPQVRDNDGITPLMVAAARYPLDNIQALLAAGARLDIRDHVGRTALHHATVAGRHDRVACLLQAGADPHARDEQGKTALDLSWTSTYSQDLLADAMGLERAPRVRLGLVHDDDEAATSVVETLLDAPAAFVATLTDYHGTITTLRQEARNWALRAYHTFAPDDTVETMLEKVNPFWRKVTPADYDDRILIGRWFAFCRHDERADEAFLRWVGIEATPAVLPRFGISEEGQSELDLHLEPFARPALDWPTLVVVSTTRPVYAAGQDVPVIALCLPTAGKTPSRADMHLTCGGVEVPRTRQRVSVKGGLAVTRWKSLPAGQYTVVMSWAGFEESCAFTVGSYSLSLAHAAWIEGPHLVDRRWKGRARVFLRGVPLPPGVAVDVSLAEATEHALTYDDGLLDIDIAAAEAAEAHSVRVAWRDDREDAAHLPLPTTDRLEACGVRVTTAGEGSEAVNGLHFAATVVEGAPLQLIHPIGEHAAWQVVRDIDRAAVTTMFPGLPARTQTFGPLKAGDELTVTLPDGARDIGFLCVGALCGDEVYEAAQPFCPPPALRVSSAGPALATIGETVRMSVRVDGPAAKRATIAVLVQDVRFHCELEREAAAQRMAALLEQYREVEGPPPPLFSAAWLDGTFRFRRHGRVDRRPKGTILVDCLPTERRGGGLFEAVGGALGALASLLPTAPQAASAGQARAGERTPLQEEPPPGETIFADLVKNRHGMAEISFAAPAHPCTLSVQVVAVDAATASWTTHHAAVRISAPIELFTDAVTPAMMVEDAGRVTGRLSVASTVGPVRLEASIDGEACPFTPPLEGSVPADQGLDLLLPLRPGLVTVRASAGRHAVARTFRVRRGDRVTERVRRMVVLSEGQTFRIAPDDHVHEIRLAGLDEVLRCTGKALSDYSHKCCEQTAAAMIGAWGTLLSPNGDGRLPALGSLSAGLQRLQSMWRDDGFALYPQGESASEYWGHRTYLHLLAMQRFGRGLGDDSTDLARRVLDALDRLVARCQAVYAPIARNGFKDCYEAWLASDSAAALKAVTERWQVVSRDTIPLAGCVLVDGNAVATRAETCYASAVLLDHEPSRRRHLAEIQGAMSWIGSQMKKGGRLYSTTDSSALIALLSTARAWFLTSGKVRLDGEAPLAPAEAQTRLERGTAREIACTEGQVQVLVDATVESEITFVSGDTFEARFERDGRPVDEAPPGAVVHLVVDVGAYEPGTLAHVVLPPCLALEEGGTRLQAFQRDFEGASALTVPLRAIGRTGAEPWHGAVALRNMFREEVQAARRVAFLVR